MAKTTNKPPQKGTFSGAFYDDITETLFLYFDKTTTLDMSGGKRGFDTNELEELCVFLNPENYEKMRQYFIDHPTKDNLV